MNKGKANRVQAIRQNISLREGLLGLEGQYKHTNRENKTLKTEYNIRLWGKTVFSGHTSRENAIHINTSKKLCKIKFPDVTLTL